MTQKPRSTRRRAPEPKPAFRFLGFSEGWYALRADLSPMQAMAALEYKNSVSDWMMAHAVTPGTWGHLANGNTPDYPIVPAFEDGTGLCLLLKRPADVLRFADTFPCDALTTQTLMRAIRAEASVHRVILADIARIAYEASRQFLLIFGTVVADWDTLGQDTPDAQQLWLQQTSEALGQPTASAAEVHEAWVDLRLKDGWTWGDHLDLKRWRHPLLMPFRKLTEREQTRQTLVLNAIRAVAPLLHK